MYGIYLKCETCGKTIGGEDVTPKQQGIPTLTRWEGKKLRELAAERGWTSGESDTGYCPDYTDYCPDCRPASTLLSSIG